MTVVSYGIILGRRLIRGAPVSGTEIKVLLISFIWVVGLTRILECFGALWVARKRVRFAVSQLF